MNEHEDDVEPEVDEDADIETVEYPILDEDAVVDIGDDVEENADPEEDESEL